MKFSIAEWTFLYGQYASDPWPLNRILEWTASAGFDGTELCGFHLPSLEDVYDDPSKCASISNLARQNSLEIACYAAWCRQAPPSLSSPEVYLARFEKALRFCVNCNIPVMRLDSGSNIEPLSDEEFKIRFDRLVGNWRSAARLAASAGITLVFESEPPMFLNKPSEVIAAADAVNEPNFKLLFDTSHAYLSAVKGACQTGDKEILPGGVIEYIHKMGHRIGYVHMIDTDGTLSREDAAGTSVHLPLGEGILNFDQIIEALWPYAGELPYWSLDYYACRDPEHTGIESLRFLKDRISHYQSRLCLAGLK